MLSTNVLVRIYWLVVCFSFLGKEKILTMNRDANLFYFLFSCVEGDLWQHD